MLAVIREGQIANAERDDLIAEIGPNGTITTELRREPGFLGSLLFGSTSTDEGVWSFVVIEMWDERHATVDRFVAPPQTKHVINWTNAGRRFVAVR